ncbi:MAG TPA: LOG family protein, partial [Dysgonamonadaceae bacterium]|nr:LOG family protein [Dysgonamonadaceae bacterium]HPD43518.1 LOG family protein [Dysgonamonadaceae bacterium]HRS41019.1 LOG family protein [Dysgonamonadaceae bacterium]
CRNMPSFCKIIDLRILGIIININGYYDLLLGFFDKMISEQFMSSAYYQMWKVVSSPEEAIESLKNFPVWNPSFTKYDEKEL